LMTFCFIASTREGSRIKSLIVLAEILETIIPRQLHVYNTINAN
jgi:hypothetical protein